MDDSTMQSLILKSLAFIDEITYAFQGGEPTLAGIDFFKKFIAYVNQHKDKQKIHYVIQTNGYALNKDWIQLFKQYGYNARNNKDQCEVLYQIIQLQMIPSFLLLLSTMKRHIKCCSLSDLAFHT